MNKNDAETYLKRFQRSAFPRLVERELPAFSEKSINALIGPRRAGKTSMMLQVMKDLMEAGHDKKGLLYLNFEDLLLIDVTFKDIPAIVELHERLFGTDKPILFLDEPQAVAEWERAVRHLHDQGHRIFISGSSAKMLSKEIATSLRGRSVTRTVLPFSFKEYLSLKDIAHDSEKQLLLKALEEYLHYGGFPEVLLEEDDALKADKLREYLELIIYRDIVERHGVKDPEIIRWLVKAVITSNAKEMSINKLYQTLRSQQRRIAKNDVYAYISMLKDSLFLWPLQRFSWSVRKRETVSKAYLCDVGFHSVGNAGTDRGRKMENLVHLKLARETGFFDEISYWKNAQQEEVDFVLKKGDHTTQLLQVCYAMDDEDTKKREIRALLKAGKELRCENMTVITYETESQETVEWFGIKGTIRYVPITQWLLT